MDKFPYCSSRFSMSNSVIENQTEKKKGKSNKPKEYKENINIQHKYKDWFNVHI